MREILTPSMNYKAVLDEKNNGVVAVTYHRWWPEVTDEDGDVWEAYWSQVEGPSFIAYDFVEETVKKELKRLSGEEI